MDTQNSPLKGIRGQILSFKADPFVTDGDSCYDYFADGLVVVRDGIIQAVGNYADVQAKYPELQDVDAYEDALIMPGFIDTHVHYVQSPMIGSYGETLLTWLNRYTFPMEARYRDKAFADEVARMFFRTILRQGTTTANIFATTFGESVDAIFEESERRNMRTVAGKVLQDRNLPDNLKDMSAEESVELSEALLKKWHKRGRQLYSVIPRFAPTSTPRQLELAGDLYQRYVGDGVYMHTHLDESEDEIRWVKELFPDSKNYTDVYRQFGLLGPRTVMAHCCLVEEVEWQMLYDHGCSVAHCPSSNLFIGDGQFRYWEAKKPGRPLRVGVATDVGGGTNFSVVRQLGEAYKVGMLHCNGMDAKKTFYLATLGGAEVLSLQDTIGSLRPGYEADIAVLDLKPSEFTAWRLGFAEDIFEKLFVLQTMGLDNLVKATYVFGRKVFDRDSDTFPQ